MGLRGSKVEDKASPKGKGRELEERVYRILQRLGKRNIVMNWLVRDSHGHWSEIDLRHGLLWHHYIECKNYAADHAVPLDDVSKFKEVLQLNRLSTRRALFVTTSTFSPRATTIGIRCMDGAALDRWEARSVRVARRRAAARALAAAAVLAAAAAGAASDGGLPGALSRLWDAARGRLARRDAP